MNTMQWTISRTRARGGLELLAIAGDQASDTDGLDPEEEIEIEIEVIYEPGYWIPGQLTGPPEDCFPDDGADPEIVSVYSNGKDISDSLTDQEIINIVDACIEHQVAQEVDAAEEDAERRYDAWKEAQEMDY